MILDLCQEMVLGSHDGAPEGQKTSTIFAFERMRTCGVHRLFSDFQYGQLKVGIAGFCQLRLGCRGLVLFTVYYFIYLYIMYIIYKRPGGS